MDQSLADFKETIDLTAPRLLQITEAQSEQPRAEDHWSSKQIIGHLIDSAANNHARFVLGQIKDDLVFPGYDQNGWVQIQHYQARFKRSRQESDRGDASDERRNPSSDTQASPVQIHSQFRRR